MTSITGMNELADVCGRAGASKWTIKQLTDRCVSPGQSLSLVGSEIVLIAAGVVLAVILVLVQQLKKKEEGIALETVGVTFEGALYAALAGWAGTTGGLIFAELIPPLYMGILFSAFALVAFVAIILSAANGDGDKSGKGVGGLMLFLMLLAFLSIAAIGCFRVPTEGRAGPEYEMYLNAVSLFIGAAAMLDAILAHLRRSVHYLVGWLLIPLNASWGWISMLLGLMHRFASYHCNQNHGGFAASSDRRFYTCYRSGFQLRSGFDFTAGWVMTADSSVEKHERVHVIEHLIAGPIFLLSYVGWFIVWLLPGAILGLFRGGVFCGVEDCGYFNNPWEVIAYEVQGKSGRASTSTNWKFGDGLAWTLSVIWILGSAAAFVLFVIARMGT